MPGTRTSPRWPDAELRDAGLCFHYVPRFQAEEEQSKACKKFEEISALAKTELVDLKKRRVEAFNKSLAELADLQVKQSKVGGLDGWMGTQNRSVSSVISLPSEQALHPAECRRRPEGGFVPSAPREG